jgi:charged multivesicular body protein 1
MFDFFKSSEQVMQEQLFNIKFTAKSMIRQSKKCEKNEKAKRKLLAKALKDGNIDIARV